MTRDYPFVYGEEYRGVGEPLSSAAGVPTPDVRMEGRGVGGGRKRILVFLWLIMGIPASAGQTHYAGDKGDSRGWLPVRPGNRRAWRRRRSVLNVFVQTTLALSLYV